MIVNVVSTGYDATPHRLLASLEKQRGVDWQLFTNDGKYTNKAHFEFLTETIANMPDNMVVASVDLDDWLCGADALSWIAHAHARGALVTYGNFIYADGRPSFTSRGYAPGEDIRKVPWRATHLKTFRAALFKRIHHSHLKLPNGTWLPYARDLALMFPMLEMAGHDRSVFINENLYVYDSHASTEFRGIDLDLERRCVAYVRSLPPYERIP